MTKTGTFKRRVRARAAKTGESYTTARMHVSGSSQSESASQNSTVRLAVAQMTIRKVRETSLNFAQAGKRYDSL